MFQTPDWDQQGRDKGQDVMTRQWVFRLLTASALGIYFTIIGSSLYFAPGYLAEKLVIAETERRAGLWQVRVLSLLEEAEHNEVPHQHDDHDKTHRTETSAGGYGFNFTHLDNHSQEAIKHFVQASDAYRVSLFNREGKSFWSTGSEMVDDISNESFYQTKLKRGKSVQKLAQRKTSEIEGYDAEHVGEVYANEDIRTVSRIYIPVMQGSQLKGIVEAYRDITDQISIYKTRLLIAGAIISLTLTFTVCSALLYSYQYRKRTRILADVQREKEQAALRKELRRNREVRLLSQLSEWMQASKSMDELFEIASSILHKLLPDAAGSIYVYSNSRDVLEGMTSWNGGKHQAEMLPDECWGLRRGRVYIHGRDEIDFACSHDHHSHDEIYVCIPIVAHGDTIGLLHLGLGTPSQDEKLLDQSIKLAQTCAEQLSLAIANVRLRDELRNQSIRDPLTGLFNRRHFFDTCRNQIGRSRRRSQTFSIASFDVDHFKLFNDNHGHDAGDIVLRAVGECLLEEFDGNDIAFRIGGEEFTILLDNVIQEEAFDRIEKLRKKIEDIVLHYGDKTLPNVTISAGVAMFPSDGDMPQELMKAADQALYRAKSAGRNQVMLVNAPTDAESDIDWQAESSEDDRNIDDTKDSADIKDLQEALVKATG